MSTEELVMAYWRSWQGSTPDWAAMRSCLADEVDMERGPMSADQLVEMASKGTPWKDVTMVDAIFADRRAAILYDGTDTLTGEQLRISELLTVDGDKITKLRAAIPATAGFG